MATFDDTVKHIALAVRMPQANIKAYIIRRATANHMRPQILAQNMLRSLKTLTPHDLIKYVRANGFAAGIDPGALLRSARGVHKRAKTPLPSREGNLGRPRNTKTNRFDSMVSNTTTVDGRVTSLTAEPVLPGAAPSAPSSETL